MQDIECGMSPRLLDKLVKKIETETGLSFSGSKQRDLHHALRKITLEAGFGRNEEACAGWFLEGPWNKAKTELCAFHLTVGETYFFREPRAFDLVRDYAREKAQSADGPLRLWSAGCCTGEEPYSIAMVLRDRVPELDPGRISILATDLNRNNLDHARAGIYRHWSFRTQCERMQELYFSAEGQNQFRIHERIRKMVRFEELNLASSEYISPALNTGTVDIIFCRNVLMYFSREQAKSVIARFHDCLVDGGWLIVSPCEASSELFAGFTGVYYPDAIYFQKTRPVVGKWTAHHACQAGTSSGRDECGSAGNDRPGDGSPEQPPRRSLYASSDRTGTEVTRNVRNLARQKGTAAAINYLEKVLESGSPTAELYHTLALFAMEAGDARKALQSLKRAIYLTPDSIIDHYLMGLVLLAQDKQLEAVRQFSTAVELLDPLNDEAPVPGTDGLPAAYLRQSMQGYLQKGRQ